MGVHKLGNDSLMMAKIPSEAHIKVSHPASYNRHPCAHNGVRGFKKDYILKFFGGNIGLENHFNFFKLVSLFFLDFMTRIEFIPNCRILNIFADLLG